MERFYRQESSAGERRARHFNQAEFETNAKIALLTQMLEILCFPASSPEFAKLERQAIGISRSSPAHYLAYLDAQAAFEGMKKHLKGDGAESTATEATIAKENGGSE